MFRCQECEINVKEDVYWDSLKGASSQKWRTAAMIIFRHILRHFPKNMAAPMDLMMAAVKIKTLTIFCCILYEK